MTNGYYTSEVRIKKDAMPIDNITKFAWNDDDYETVEVFVEYTDCLLYTSPSPRDCS